MRPLADMPERDAARVRLALTGIDDTLTCDGRLPADACRALEDLSAAGFLVAPITGRPAGWCDMIARCWPVAGVVGENGALSMTRRFARDGAGLDIDRDNDKVVFVGDSPNDAPMFAFFRNACGVSGVRDFAGRLEAEPAHVTEGGGDRGFVEVAERLLHARDGGAA